MDMIYRFEKVAGIIRLQNSLHQSGQILWGFSFKYTTIFITQLFQGLVFGSRQSMGRPQGSPVHLHFLANFAS